MKTFDDIIFQRKNKAYGAYQLRKRYPISVCYSLLITLSFVLIFSAIMFFKYLKDANDLADRDLQQEIIEYEEMKMLDDFEVPLPNTPPPLKKEAKNIEQTYDVVDTLKPTPDTLKLAAIEKEELDSLTNDSLASDSSQEGVKDGIKDGTIYRTVDILPKFPGGKNALDLFIRKNFNLTAEMKKKNIKGVVVIEFNINETGKVEKVKVNKGIDPLIDNELVRIIKLLPKWSPAIRKGLAVKFSYKYPIRF